ncbi:MAG TPA: hypothetical protein VIM11_27205 [Tepidisphaeraceae bacterium]|jgi:hypothetical protein
MVQATDSVNITVPRAMLSTIVELSAELNDRMHQLLEKNTNGNLRSHEKAELETLVRMPEFGQIISMAMESTNLMQ